MKIPYFMARNDIPKRVAALPKTLEAGDFVAFKEKLSDLEREHF